MQKDYNYSLFTLKAICAFFVVCLHAPVPFISGVLLTPLGKIAVPLFFMISGYYLYTGDISRLKRKLWKMLIKSIKILVTVNIFYLVVRALIHLHNGDFPVFEELNSYSVLYVTFLARHLWYITALIFACLIFLFLIYTRLFEKAIIPVLIVTMSYSVLTREFHLFGGDLDGVFLSIPYLLLGTVFRKYEYRLLQYNTIQYNTIQY